MRPVLKYANITWFPHTQNNVSIIENVQRKAARFIFHKYGRYDSPTELLKKVGLLFIADRAKLSRLKLLPLLLNDPNKIDKTKYVKRSEVGTTRNKHSNTLVECSFYNSSFRYSLFDSTIKDWNKLDTQCFSYKNVDLFIGTTDNQLICQSKISYVIYFSRKSRDFFFCLILVTSNCIVVFLLYPDDFYNPCRDWQYSEINKQNKIKCGG